jgi:DNA helicase II / ATP-dependent DNA helicase PcrA
VDILDELNEQQRQAVTAPNGQVLVLAGPGSGKTRVLTLRVAYLIHALNIRPYQILAVTFTNKAAREMRTRLENFLGAETTSELWLGTFHANCAKILRREPEYLPFKSNFVIYDEDDQLSLMKRTIKDLNLDDKSYRPGGVLSAISKAKNHLLLPADFPRQTYRDEVVARIYERYQKMLETNNAVDFDDLLLWTTRLLAEHVDVREKYAKRFQYVLVDEFQDTNHAQYELLRHLSSYHNNLFVVGDEDQSIYRWRGADSGNVLRFERDFKNCTKILLERNYRSTQNVLDAARSVIERNRNRTQKNLHTSRDKGDPIILYEAPDDYSEAAYVIDTISKLIRSGQARGGDIAVMYRVNAQSRLLEDAFLRVGMPYRLVGAQRFYGRREIKDVISYLRLVHNPLDDVSLLRIINVPPRKVGDKTLVALQLAARQSGLTPGEVLIRLALEGENSACAATFGPREIRSLADFGLLLASWRELAAREPLIAVFDRILTDIDYRSYVEDQSEPGIDRWANVEELRKLAYEYQDLGMDLFLQNLALVSDQDTLPENRDAPTLLTLHAAKGLEFSHVFIMGLDEGLLPHSRSLESNDPEEMAEERRLFYVGMTRAKNHLYLVRAERRNSYGTFQDSLPSRFLDDIPANLTHGQIIHRTAKASRWTEDSSYSNRNRINNSTRWEGDSPSHPSQKVPGPKNVSPALTSQPRYRAGMHVLHLQWGEGIIIEDRIDTLDGEEMVTVHFQSVGLKRLLASSAKLEIIV